MCWVILLLATDCTPYRTVEPLGSWQCVCERFPSPPFVIRTSSCILSGPQYLFIPLKSIKLHEIWLEIRPRKGRNPRKICRKTKSRGKTPTAVKISSKNISWARKTRVRHFTNFWSYDWQKPGTTLPESVSYKHVNYKNHCSKSSRDTAVTKKWRKY